MKRTIFKKAPSFLLAVFMMMSALVVMPITASADEDITIGTVQELINFKQAVVDGNTFEGKTIQLTADIDMSSAAANWPVATGTTYPTFSGTFDGNGKSIKNPTLTVGSWRGFLFDDLQGAVVKNLRIEGGTVTTSSGGGLISGRVTGTGEKAAKIQNVYINTTVSAGGNYVGAVIGRVQGDVTIESCVVESTVNGTGKNAVGGFVGEVYGATNVIKLCECAFLGGVINSDTMRSGAFIPTNKCT